MRIFRKDWRLGRWVLGASTILSLTLLVGRLTGLLREIQLATSFGVSAEADVAVLLLTLPDLLVNLLLSGGLSAALVPRFRALPEAQANALFRYSLTVSTSIFSAFALLFLIWPRLILILFAPGLHYLVNLPGPLVLIFLLSALPLTSASGVAAAYLNADHRFFLAGCGTLIFNLGVLTGLSLGQASGQTLLGLCVGICVGSLIRAVTQLVALPRNVWHGKSLESGFDFGFLRAFATAALSASLMLSVPLFIRAMASTLGGGFVASFNYTLKLVELPVGIFLGSIATVALSRFSEREAAGDSIGAQLAAAHDLRRALLLSLAVSTLGFWFSLPVVRIALARGAMNSDSIYRISSLFQIAILGVPAVAVIVISTAALNAAHRTNRVFIGTASCLMFLPFLALPGILLKSDKLLILSIVVFQDLLAVLLCRFAGLRPFGVRGWFNREMLIKAFVCLSIVVVTICVDWLFSFTSNFLTDPIRLGISVVGFVLAIILPGRIYQAVPFRFSHLAGK